jgi:hypothetical protein
MAGRRWNWLPGVSSDEASDGDGKPEAPGLGHNGGPALDQTGGQQPRDPNQTPPSIIPPTVSSGSNSGDAARQNENSAAQLGDLDGAISVGGWSATRSLSASENAVSHWNKHAAEFPEYSSAEEYVKATQNFVQNPPDGTLSKTRANGDTLLYDPRTNTFAVSSANGAPRTMFRPQDGSSYWRNIK